MSIMTKIVQAFRIMKFRNAEHIYVIGLGQRKMWHSYNDEWMEKRNSNY